MASRNRTAEGKRRIAYLNQLETAVKDHLALVPGAGHRMKVIVNEEARRVYARERKIRLQEQRITGSALRVMRMIKEKQPEEIWSGWLAAQMTTQSRGWGTELRSLENNGLLAGRWVERPKRAPTRYFDVTDAGRKFMEEEL